MGNTESSSPLVSYGKITQHDLSEHVANLNTSNMCDDVRKHPRVQTLLEKGTLESLMKSFFQRVYDEKEAVEMENHFKKVLSTKLYDNIYYNKENEPDTKALMNKCLESLCETSLNRKKHTPSTLLELAGFFIKLGDSRLACEVIWGSACLAIEVLMDNHNFVKLKTHGGKSRFAAALSDEIRLNFGTCELCHSSFYTNDRTLDEVKTALKDAEELIKLLRDFKMTDEEADQLKAKHEKGDFDKFD